MSDSTNTSNDNKSSKVKTRKPDSTLHSQELSIKRRKREVSVHNLITYNKILSFKIRTSKHDRSKQFFFNEI